MTLIPSSIRDESTLAIDRQAERLQELPLASLLVYLVDVAADDVLTHLAWQFRILHTVAWRNAEDIASRRGLIKSAWRRHRLKGTLAGFKLAAADAGCEVVHAISPPAKIYLAAALTTMERNDFISRYPQLRIYRRRTAGSRVGIMMGEPLGLRFPVVSDAELRINPRAWLVKDGVATELTVLEKRTTTAVRQAETATITEVAMPGQRDRLSFCHGWPRHLTVTKAAQRFYRFTVDTPYLESVTSMRRVAVDPGLTPLDIRPDHVAEQGEATGLFCDKFVSGYFRATTAADRIYERFHLFDPTIDVECRKVIQHLNSGRWGMPRHHAELTVSVPGRIIASAAGRFVTGHLVTQPKTRLNELLEAMRDMSRASDRISIGFVASKELTASDTLTAGDYLFGQYI